MNNDTLNIIVTQFPLALWESFYVTLLATIFATIIGLPIGVLLVIGKKDGIKPLPKILLDFIDLMVNLLRSIPFLILMIMVFPLTRLIVGTSIGTIASIVPLTIAAFPFIARLVESSLKELDPNIIEMAQCCGATTLQIIVKVMLVECLPSLVNNLTIAFTTILGFTASSGIIGGGGLGKIAISYGYYRYNYQVMLAAVVVIIVLVQVVQTIGTKLSLLIDHRIKK